jgi:hypothetical protein
VVWIVLSKAGASDVVSLWETSVKELKLKKHGFDRAARQDFNDRARVVGECLGSAVQAICKWL